VLVLVVVRQPVSQRTSLSRRGQPPYLKRNICGALLQICGASMSDLFLRLHGVVPDHTITTVLGTVVKFYLSSQSPPIVVKEIVVHAIQNENEMNTTAEHYVASHTHDDSNISSVIASEKSLFQDSQYTLRLAFHFMNRFSIAHVIDSETFTKKQFSGT
jgi:hypothetical protein